MKKLLAMAVGAAIAMPGAALAEKPEFYGKLNLSLDSVDIDAPSMTPAIESDTWEVRNNKSRLGVRGEFDTDVADLKAIYTIEYEIQPDDGLDLAAPAYGAGTEVEAVNGTLFASPDVDGSTAISDQLRQRNIFAGLSGGFGTLKVGFFDTPLKAAEGGVDQFNDTRADLENLMAGQYRAANTIQYSTPKLGDMITINLAANPGEELETSTNVSTDEINDGLADAFSVSAVLEMDMFYAALANETDRPGALLDSNTQPGSLGTVDMMRLVGGINMSMFEAGLLYQVAEDAEADAEDTSMMLSGAYKMNAVKLKLQYGMTEADNSEDEWTQLTLGADYQLSKQSTVYAYIDNKELEPATGDATEIGTFGLGLSHAF